MGARVVRHLPGLTVADRIAVEAEALRFEREGGPTPGPRAATHRPATCPTCTAEREADR
jgi:hypothetical protein